MLDSETFPAVAGTILTQVDEDEVIDIDLSDLEEVADPAAETVHDGPKVPAPPDFASRSGGHWARFIPLLRFAG